MYMKKWTLKLKIWSKLLKVVAVFVFVINHKILLSKWITRLKDKGLNKKENVHMGTLHLFQKVQGVI